MRESALQKKILKKLREFSLKDGFWINTHGSPMQIVGIPDIIGCYRGRFCAFEVKRPGEELTRLQAFTIRLIRRAGGIALRIQSFEEAEAILKTVPELPSPGEQANGDN